METTGESADWSTEGGQQDGLAKAWGGWVVGWFVANTSEKFFFFVFVCEVHDSWTVKSAGIAGSPLPRLC